MISLTPRTPNLKDWFPLGSGFNGSLGLTRDFWVRNALGKMDRLGSSSSAGLGRGVVRGEFYKIPGLVLGNLGIRAIPTNVDLEPTGNTEATGGLGMDILKRFNTILDYRENVIYLRPNSLIDTPFRQPSGWTIPVILAGVVPLLAGAAVFVAKRPSLNAAIDSAVTPSEPKNE